MAADPSILSTEEVKNFFLGAIVVTAGFVAYKHEYTLSAVVFYGAVTILILLLREIGQRMTAHLMQGYVDLEFSQQGAIFSIAAAIFSVATTLPIVFLIPLWNDFWNEKYESWGYEIPVIWSKREYWIVSVGILYLLIFWFTAYNLEFYQVAEAVALFTFFQLLPLRDNTFTEGALDGAYILLHSGFMWLVFMGIAVAGIVLPV